MIDLRRYVYKKSFQASIILLACFTINHSLVDFVSAQTDSVEQSKDTEVDIAATLKEKITSQSQQITKSLVEGDFESALDLQSNSVRELKELLRLEPFVLKRLVREELLQTTLSNLAKTKGQDRTDMLDTIGVIQNSSVDIAMRRYAEAEKSLLKSLAEIKRLSANNEYLYLEMRIHSQLGSIYTKSKRFPKAIEQYKAQCELRVKQLGQTHVDFINETVLLANAYLQNGMIDDADKCLREFLTRERKQFRDKSLSYASGLNGLALVSLERKQFLEAESLAMRSLGILSKLDELKSSDAALAYMIMGDVNAALGEDSEVEKYYASSYETFKASIGEISPEMSMIIKRFSKWLKTQKRWKEANELDSQAEYLDSFFSAPKEQVN